MRRDQSAEKVKQLIERISGVYKEFRSLTTRPTTGGARAWMSMGYPSPIKMEVDNGRRKYTDSACP